MQVALGVIWTEAYTADEEIIPVSVMIDEGSNTTLFRDDLLQRLKLTGKKLTLDLVGVTGAESYKSQQAHVRFRLPDGEETVIAGLTIPQVARPTPIIDWNKLKKRWPHLADVPVKKSGGKIDVLLGLDHSHLVAVLETRVGGDDEPFASRTRLGWIVRGLLGGDVGPMTARSHHLTSTSASSGQSTETSLHAEFQRLCTTEVFGTEFKGDGLSESDKIAEKINFESEGEHGQWRMLAPDSSPSFAGTILSCLIVNFGGGCSGEIRRPKILLYFTLFCLFSDLARHLLAWNRTQCSYLPRCLFLLPTLLNEVTSC